MSEADGTTVRVGLITRAVGVRGEVAVMPLTDDPSRFRALRDVFIEAPEPAGQLTRAVIDGVRFHRGRVVVRFEGCGDADTAGSLRGRYVAISRDQLAPLKEGSYYVFDLIGCDVFDASGKALGSIYDVLETGSNDVYVVKRAGGGADILIPAIKSVIREVDTAARRVVADWNEDNTHAV